MWWSRTPSGRLPFLVCIFPHGTGVSLCTLFFLLFLEDLLCSGDSRSVVSTSTCTVSAWDIVTTFIRQRHGDLGFGDFYFYFLFLFAFYFMMWRFLVQVQNQCLFFIYGIRRELQTYCCWNGIVAFFSCYVFIFIIIFQ